MAKCSTKGCKKGAVGRIQVFESTDVKKTRPACGTCISQSHEKVKLNDNVKIAESDIFLNKLNEFAHEHFCDKDALAEVVKGEEFGVLDDIAVADTSDHRGSFRYKLNGIRYLIYVGSRHQFKRFNHRDDISTIVKYRINENTVNDLFPSEK